MERPHNKGIEPPGDSLGGFIQKLVAPVGSRPAFGIK